MGFENRVELYKAIEHERGKPLITYFTSRRQSSGGRLSMDVIPEFCEHIRQIPEEVKEIDLLISSQGGDPIAAWRIINLLRERFDKISVLIPYDAHSAATVLALGADEIIMHPFSCLGPIDVQINIGPMGQNKQFSTEDISSYIDFLHEDLELKDSTIGASPLFSELKPTEVGVVKKSMNFIKSIATKLLKTHMENDEDIENIVSKFTNSFHHGYTIGRKEAKELGLPISETSRDVEECMWKIWEDADFEMKCRTPFDPFKIIMDNTELMNRLNSNPLIPVSPIPAPMPIQVPVQKIETATDETIVAMVESINARSSFKTKAIISALRNNDLSISCNVTIVSFGWKTKTEER